MQRDLAQARRTRASPQLGLLGCGQDSSRSLDLVGTKYVVKEWTSDGRRNGTVESRTRETPSISLSATPRWCTVHNPYASGVSLNISLEGPAASPRAVRGRKRAARSQALACGGGLSPETPGGDPKACAGGPRHPMRDAGQTEVIRGASVHAIRDVPDAMQGRERLAPDRGAGFRPRLVGFARALPLVTPAFSCLAVRDDV